ncbi:uncharacterized protein LOC116252545 [Nymphaea colorata]|uniref:uncharacterized protein LOC116252545 n=1 Tax=Nymphaea colorata TaxID=210225 RepID=UPI00129D8DFE|nr:uncharacterized protein LOC116252545 [Nymphaea colorata]
MDKEGKAVMLEPWRGDDRGCYMMRLLVNLKRVRMTLLVWNKNSFGSLSDNIAKLQSRLEGCRDCVEQGIEGALDDEHRVRQQLSQALLMEEVMQAKRKIRSLECDGIEYVQSGKILEVWTDYFKKILAMDDAQGILFGGIDNIARVTEYENEQLCQSVLEEEVTTTMWSLDKDNVAGLDGFHNYFYQECWEMVMIDVVNVVQDFFSMREKFDGRHRLQQGDSLSPYLFLIVMEMFNRLLIKEMISKNVIVPKIYRVRPNGCAMLFADDVIMVDKATKRTISITNAIL